MQKSIAAINDVGTIAFILNKNKFVGHYNFEEI